MKFQETVLKGNYVITLEKKNDSRGFLSRLYCNKILRLILKRKNILQINRTLTKKRGTVRGLHFQYHPYSETKIVTCIKGKVWDVVVDLRKNSPTFLHYHAEILSDNNLKSFFIPEGFAHGFQTLTNNCEMLYFHTSFYNSKYEGAINATDPIISVKWPRKITHRSKRDIGIPLSNKNFSGIKL